MREGKAITVSDIIAENDSRRNKMFSRFNPITGEGSVGERVVVCIPDFPLKKLWLPKAMADNTLVNGLVKHKGIDLSLIHISEPTRRS